MDECHTIGAHTDETLVWFAKRSPLTRAVFPVWGEFLPTDMLNSAGPHGTKFANWRSLMRSMLLCNYKRVRQATKGSMGMYLQKSWSRLLTSFESTSPRITPHMERYALFLLGVTDAVRFFG